MPRAITTTLFLLITLFAGLLRAEEFLRPLRTGQAPVIDGKLDEAVWRQAPLVTGFRTFSPDFGKDPAESTLVYMAYDDEHLFFAFRCFDRQPDKIKTAVTSRDNIAPDDWVCVNFDSFNDRQSLYALYVNPAGIQMDSRYAAGVEDFNFDMVFHSAGSVDASGYNVEIAVPLKSIRYTDANPVTMRHRGVRIPL